MHAGRAAFLVLCAALVGCTLVFQTHGPTQCATDADCDAVPALAGRVCTSGFCVPKGPAPTPVADAGSGCVSTALCTQANTNRASVCEKAGGPCVPWQIDGCPHIDGAWGDPNVLMIGLIAPLTVKQWDGQLLQQAYGRRIYEEAALALAELAKASPNGFRSMNGTFRPIGLLTCDSKGDPATVKAMFEHLTNVVHSDALIMTTDDDLAAVEPAAAARQTAIACAACQANLPQDVLAWRMVPPIALEAPLLARRVADLQAVLQGSGRTPTRVALLTQPNMADRAFADAFRAAAVFNGKSSADNAKDGNYFEVETEDGSKKPIQPDVHAAAIAGFGADVVVTTLGPELPLHYVPFLEADYANAGKPKPHYLVTSFAWTAIPELTKLDPQILRRVDGSRAAPTAEVKRNADALFLAFRAPTNGDAPNGTEGAYDAFYSLLYAIGATIPFAPGLDGPKISSGFEKLVATPGGSQTIDVGFGGLSLGLGIVGRGSPIDLRGTVTTLDWDTSTRDLRPETLLTGSFCFHVDATGTVTVVENAGLSYTQGSGVSGTFDTATCN